MDSLQDVNTEQLKNMTRPLETFLLDGADAIHDLRVYKEWKDSLEKRVAMFESLYDHPLIGNDLKLAVSQAVRLKKFGGCLGE